MSIPAYVHKQTLIFFVMIILWILCHMPCIIICTLSMICEGKEIKMILKLKIYIKKKQCEGSAFST